jgi:hypothetical protein
MQIFNGRHFRSKGIPQQKQFWRQVRSPVNKLKEVKSKTLVHSKYTITIIEERKLK